MRLTKQQADRIIVVMLILIILTLLVTFTKEQNTQNADAEWYLQRGIELDSNHDEEEAIIYYSSAIHLNPNYEEAYTRRCGARWYIGEYFDALLDCERSLELNSLSARAYGYRCLILKELKDSERALPDCNRAIELNPVDSTSYNIRGILYSDIGESQLAIDDYTTALQYDPLNAIILFNRGLTYNDLGEYELALADFENALAHDTTNFDRIYEELISSYQINENYDAALETANLMVRHLPRNPQSFYIRGSIYFVLGRHSPAMIDFQQAINLDATFEDAYIMVASLYTLKGQEEEAAYYYCAYGELTNVSYEGIYDCSGND